MQHAVQPGILKHTMQSITTMPSRDMTQTSNCRSVNSHLEGQRSHQCGGHLSRWALAQQHFKPSPLTQHTCDCLAVRQAARPCRLQSPAVQHALTASIRTWHTRSHITGGLRREAVPDAASPQTQPIDPTCLGPPGRVPNHQVPLLQASMLSQLCAMQDPARISSPGTLEDASLWGLRPKVATKAAAVLGPAIPCALLLMLPVPMTWMLMVPAMVAAAPLRSPETVRGLMPCKHMADS